jgi:hypothetical protein
MQPILTWLTKPHNQAIITIVFIYHRVIIAIAAIHKATKSAETVDVFHLLPHPVPLNTAATSLQMRVIGIAQAMQLPASTSPSVSMARLIIAIMPHCSHLNS